MPDNVLKHLLRIKSLRLVPMIAIACLACAPLASVRAQDLSAHKTRGRRMLETIKQDIKDNYFDPKFNGIDLDAHFKKAGDQVKQAVDANQILGIIASTLLVFNDAHTGFRPPALNVAVDYGWEKQMIGDKCYVVSVDQDSDAATKGLKPGDQVLSIFDVAPTRDSLWEIEYLFNWLRPVNAMNVVVQRLSGKPRRLELLTKVKKVTIESLEEKARTTAASYQYYYDLNNELIIWKMPTFLINEKGVDAMMKLVGQHRILILDLRGNGGGYSSTLLRLLGYFFDHDIVVGQQRTRKGLEPMLVKSIGNKAFMGHVVVLVDSKSASASEIFARTMQLSKRGIVVGDRTSGHVRVSRIFTHVFERNSYVTLNYGTSVTIKDLIMHDGRSLERIGVTPDKVLLPDPESLSNGDDPVLVASAEILGARLDPKTIGAPSKLKTERW